MPSETNTANKAENIGKKVFSKNNKLLGQIKKIDGIDLKSEYFILETKSFLGLKHYNYILPWKLVTTDNHRLVASITPKDLKSAPELKNGEWTLISKLEYFDARDNYFPM